MEIDITDFVNDCDPFQFSASRAELGQDAGRITWGHACDEAKRAPMLTTDAQLDALRGWARESGGWTRDEIAAWDADACNALFVQIISGDLREMGLADDFVDEFDWDAYRERAEAGEISGNIYRGDIEGSAGFGRVFYYLGL